MQNISRNIKWLGIGLILAAGLIHVIEAPEAFEEAAYKGWLFYANGIGALAAALGIYQGKRWGWGLGLVIALGSLIGYAASRTIGLPLIPAEPDEWFEPLGVASLAAEGLFAVVYKKTRSQK